MSFSDSFWWMLLSQFTWKKHAELHQENYPLVADAVKNHCYMDDLMQSVDSIEKAIETRRQLTEMGDKAGFHVRKWVSNCPEVLEDVPNEDCTKLRRISSL